MSSIEFGFGQMRPEDASTEYNVMAFVVRQILAGIATAKVVQVKAVHPGSGTPPALGTVDVQPLVSLVDGNNNASPHGTVFGVPYLRLLSGSWEIVSDPVVGDVGLMICADRDTSGIIKQIEGGTVGASVQPVPPGSFRKFDLADGIYMGGLAGAQTVNAFMQLKTDGTLQITDSQGNVLSTSASGFSLTGNVKVTGTLEVTQQLTADNGVSVTGNVTASGTVTGTTQVVAGSGGSAVHLTTHTQSGVTTGAGVSGPPTPGS